MVSIKICNKFLEGCCVIDAIKSGFLKMPSCLIFGLFTQVEMSHFIAAVSIKAEAFAA